MALIRDYEWQDSGAVFPNAYYIISNVKVEKRAQDIPAPVDASHPTGLTGGGQDPDKAVYWKAGYIGWITVTIWSSKQARIDGKMPIGYMGIEPTETNYEGFIGTPGMDGKCVFFIDMDSSESYITQAYRHLASLPYFADATNDDDPVSEDDDEYIDAVSNTESANT